MARRTPLIVLLAIAASATVAGCGFGPGSSSGGDRVQLRVTRDFGRQELNVATSTKVAASDTVMRLLQRGVPRVKTRYGGTFVQRIGGLSGGTATGHRVDWFYYVNGSEAPKGAAATKVHPGDRIWWDHRRWDAAEGVPAVVGSFPEPFLHGPGTEKRLPVRVECIDAASPACALVAKRLVALGIPASRGTLRSSFTKDTLRVLVGPWVGVSEDEALRQIEDGPRTSGVFAEPQDGGTTLSLLGPDGHGVRKLGAGAGLVAATAIRGERPVWAVTGTDAAGVLAAANAFGQHSLHGRYAIAVDAGKAIALPVQGPAR